MKKNYVLYLDEGGDFNNDLDKYWTNECIVGGYLQEKENIFSEKDAADILVEADRACNPKKEKISSKQILESINHSTENKEEKEKITTAVLERVEKKAEFIIFQNYEKNSFGNDAKTYLNVLVDGLIQLLSKLIIDNKGNEVSLEVVAGYRKEVQKSIECGHNIYTNVEEYQERINERLSLEKIKHKNIYASKSTITISLDHDKKNYNLVLCDYICNFYITRNSLAFQKKMDSGKTYEEYLLGKFKNSNIFGLNGDEERNRILNHINSQTYDAALFDICTGIISDERNIQMIINIILGFDEKQLHNILMNLSSYMDTVVAVSRNTSSSLTYLRKAEKILLALQKENKNVDIPYLDIKLYQLTVYNHRGELIKMKQIFDECRDTLKKVIRYSENINYAYIYLNRLAVYLYDTFEMEQGEKILNELIRSIDAYELMLMEISSLEMEEGDFYSDQLGKILGTKVQYSRYQLKQKQCSYEEACKISDQAINNFIYDRDKERQYQYRAQIEAEAGMYENALRYFCKGFELEKWEQIFQEDKRNPFGFYHLSFVMKKMAKDETKQKVVKEMVKKFQANERALFSTREFPAFITIGNVGETMIQLGMDKSLIAKYYRECISFANEETTIPLFQMMIAMTYATYIAYLIENNNLKEDTMKPLNDICFSLNEAELPKSLSDINDRLKKILAEREAGQYLEFANMIQY